MKNNKRSNVRKTTEQFIKEARQVHGDKYDYSKVEYINAHTKVCIICPEHGEFWQEAHEHLNGKGCRKCAKCYKPTTEEFIDQCKKVHGDKYDYSKVEYTDSKTKVCIICPIHGEFWQTPQHLLEGHGCQRCTARYYFTQEEFINETKKIYGDKYDLSKTKFINFTTKITFECPIHGKQTVLPHNFLKGKGCPKCAKKRGASKRIMGLSKFINLATEIHNNKYDYSKVEYVNSTTKVCIICPEHGEFWQRPTDHLHGHECPKCGYKKSKYEDHELCKSLASKCKTRSEFIKKYEGAYRISKKNGWVEEFFPYKHNDATAPINYVYRFIFREENAVYVGRTLDLQREYAHHREPSSVFRYAKEHNLIIPKWEILESGLTLRESRIKEDEYVKKYREEGYTIINIGKTGEYSGAIGVLGVGKYPKEVCFKLALECKTKSEFMYKYQTAYLKMIKNGWLQECTHFIELHKPKNFWNIFENVLEEATKYKTPGEMRKNAKGAYEGMFRNGWLEMCFPKARTKKNVLAINVTDNSQIKFNSMRKCGEYFGIDPRLLTNYINSGETFKGFVLEYTEKEQPMKVNTIIQEKKKPRRYIDPQKLIKVTNKKGEEIEIITYTQAKTKYGRKVRNCLNKERYSTLGYCFEFYN